MKSTVMALVMATTGCSAEVLMRLEEPEAVWRVVVGDTASKVSRDEAVSFLQSSKQALAVVIVAETKQAANHATGKGSTDVGYIAWRNRIGYRRADACTPLLYGIRIGRNSALRSVDAKCHVEQVQITGSSNPFIVRVNGAVGRVLHVDIERTRLGKFPLWAQYFILTDSSLSPELARAFLDNLQRTAPMPNATVVLRNDAWFITSERFPLFYELDGSPGSIPTKQEFERTQEVHCGQMFGSSTDCWQNIAGGENRATPTVPAPR